ncbi:MAG: LytTR family transcriptional regulator [Lachnospiraceae bacterium]|nr:LytTR family transcriptional regulator [Lachnospiraceae bacterium]MDE6254391.1 LytTR family transcriptional regulator DNA-binding domain-containing protein [Lachnospiraceae bacterium]
MKIKIETDCNISENEIIIRCNSINDDIIRLQSLINNTYNNLNQPVFYKNEKEYYIPLEKILFFETNNGIVNAHTTNELYLVKNKLYELEEILPGFFTRVSKSTILNTHAVYSITRNITSSSIVEFENTHKQVYVSRYYYKPLQEKLKEKRLSL